LPSDWWLSGDDGSRLALAICRRCPVRVGCLDGDPDPHGVIRAGEAFSDFGNRLGDCPTCGYPQPGDRIAQRDRCPRCELPPLSRFRADVERWIAAGDDNKTMGARLGASARQVRDARQHWHGGTHKRTHVTPAACASVQSEREVA
jgi:hypothetical protein